jgi:hypothetical protein
LADFKTGRAGRFMETVQVELVEVFRVNGLVSFEPDFDIVDADHLPGKADKMHLDSSD